MTPMHRYRAAFGLALSAVVAFASPSHASVVVGGTRVVFNESKKEQSIQIVNQGKSPAMVQSWIDDGQADALPRHIKVPFVLTPPLTRLEPGQGQTLRLTYLPLTDKPLPTDHASVFYLNVLEIPPSPDASQGKNTLQLAVRTRIKLFFRPKGLDDGKPRDAADKLTWALKKDVQGAHLDVTNPTHYYVSINQASLPDGRTTESPAMVGPHASIMMPLGDKTADAPPPAGKVAFQWIDDHGATVDATSVLAAP